MTRKLQPLAGREEVLTAASAALTGPTRVLTLQGPPGSGRSAIATVLAERACASRGGQPTRLDLGGCRDLQDVLRRLGRLLDVPLSAVEGEEVLAQPGRVLAGREAKVVVIEGTDALREDLAPLLDAVLALDPAIFFIVAAPRRMRVARERIVPVGPLSTTGELPLATRVREAMGEAVPEGGDPVVALDAIVGRAIESLSPLERLVLERLAGFVDAIPPSIQALLAGPSDPQPALQRLQALHLVEPGPGVDSLRAHAAVRLVLDAREGEATREATRLACQQVALERAQAISARLRDAPTWDLLAELGHLADDLNRLMDRGGPDAAAAARALGPWWYLRGPASEARSRAESLRASPDLSPEGLPALTLLDAELRLRWPTPTTRAVDPAELVAAIELAEGQAAIGARLLTALALTETARRIDLEAAEAAAVQAGRAAEALEDGWEAGQALQVRASLARIRGDDAEAERLARAALARMPDRPHPYRASTLNLLGAILQSTGQKQEATAIYRQGIADCRAVGWVDRAALIEANLAAMIAMDRGTPDAFARLEQSAMAFRHLGMPREEGRFLADLGTLLLLRHELLAARETLLRARDCLLAGGDGGNLARVDVDLGTIAWLLGEIHEAEPLVRRGTAALEALESPVLSAWARLWHAAVLADAGRPDEALARLNGTAILEQRPEEGGPAGLAVVKAHVELARVRSSRDRSRGRVLPESVREILQRPQDWPPKVGLLVQALRARVEGRPEGVKAPRGGPLEP